MSHQNHSDTEKTCIKTQYMTNCHPHRTIIKISLNTHAKRKHRQKSSLAHIQIIVSCNILQVNRLHRLNAVQTSTSTPSASYEDHKTETMKSMQQTVISTIHVIHEDMLHMQTSCNLHQTVTSILSD